MPGNRGFPNDRSMFNGRLLWLIRIRWIAIIGAIGVCSLLSYFNIIKNLEVTLGILTLWGLLNLVFYLFLKHGILVKRFKNNGLLFLQILCDILGLLLLIHFNGGVMNPFVFFLVIPIIIAGICFQLKWVYLIAAMALVLTALLAYGTEQGWIMGHDLPVFKGWTSLCLVLGGLLFLLAYMSSKIVTTLREREHRFLNSQKAPIESEPAMEIKNRTLNGLASTFYQDIHTPLGIIRARVNSMRYAIEDMSQSMGKNNGHESQLVFQDLSIVMDKVEEIGIALDKIAILLGKKEPKKKGVNLNRLIENLTLDMLEAFRKKNIRLHLELAPQAFGVLGAENELELLFSTILKNALESVSDQRQGVISIQSRRLFREQEYALVRIRDNGPGIPPRIQKEIFDPFSSTQGPDRGMGLAIAYTIARNHGGNIRIRSRPPPGASVFVILPVGKQSIRTETILA